MKLQNLMTTAVLGFLLMSPALYANENKAPISSADPYESFNRPIFDFNMDFNDKVGKPVAEVYNQYMPQPAKTGLSNFFNNLKEPIYTANSFMQGKVEDGMNGFMRFTVNTTFGLLGILDVATPAGLVSKKEDFGQTLYEWGVWQEANYVVLPFLGPFTTRELVGSTVDSSYNPVYPGMIDAEGMDRTMIVFTGGFVDYTQVIGLIDTIKQQHDPYVFARESYLQYRNNLLYDGKAPVANLDDFNIE